MACITRWTGWTRSSRSMSMWPVCPPRPDEIINAVVRCLGLMKEDAAHGGKEWRLEKPVPAPETCPATGRRAA